MNTVIAILRLTDLIMLAVETGAKVKAEYERGRAVVEAAVREGRDLTAAEWAEIDAVTESIHNRIQES